jgi:hypothetical protein
MWTAERQNNGKLGSEEIKKEFRSRDRKNVVWQAFCWTGEIEIYKRWNGICLAMIPILFALNAFEYVNDDVKRLSPRYVSYMCNLKKTCRTYAKNLTSRVNSVPPMSCAANDRDCVSSRDAALYCSEDGSITHDGRMIPDPLDCEYVKILKLSSY